MNTRLYFFIPLILLLTACSSGNQDEVEFEQWNDFNSNYYSATKSKNAKTLNSLISQYSGNIEKIWGSDQVLMTNMNDFIRYSSDFKTRSYVNVTQGFIQIETLVDDANSIAHLRNGILNTLLMDISDSENMIYPANRVKVGSNLYLSEQIRNEKGQLVIDEKTAKNFANYLLRSQFKTRKTFNNKRIAYVNIPLIPNYISQRLKKYEPYILSAGKKHNIEPAMIMAITEIESSFNPNAVSSSDALGLMQIKLATAAKDVHRIHGLQIEPTRSYLLNPKNNIEIGSAYIAILRDVYLKDINNSLSKTYAVIASYNGGAGSVLRTFSQDRKKAFDIINSMTPDEFYSAIIQRHPSQQTRNYLAKVWGLYKKYEG